MDRRDRPMRAGARAGLAGAGGLGLALAFPPFGFAPFSVGGPALLYVALPGTPASVRALLGLVFGAAFFGVLLFWVERAGVHAWVVLSLGETCFVVLFTL